MAPIPRVLVLLALLVAKGCAESSKPQLRSLYPARDPRAARAAVGFRFGSSPSELLAAAPSDVPSSTEANQRRAVVATCWSFILTFVFALGVVLPYKGKQATLDFITGFLVEKSLSVDNLFVFLMLFEYFRVPAGYTDRVLRWGIVSALILRGVMIAVGVAAVQRFRPVLLGFALILVVSAVKMMQPEGGEEELNDNAVMKIARWAVKATDEYDGDRFFTTTADGVRRATPMLVVLLCIELSDVLFAVDSIPAVVGITHDPFIVYTSNIFAMMALRSLYTILSQSVAQLVYLRHAVAAILGFVGVKMVLEFFHMGVSSAVSLSVILGLLSVGAGASVLRNRALARAAAAPIGQPAPKYEYDYDHDSYDRDHDRDDPEEGNAAPLPKRARKARTADSPPEAHAPASAPVPVFKRFAWQADAAEHAAEERAQRAREARDRRAQSAAEIMEAQSAALE